jgi:hypothetical protein
MKSVSNSNITQFNFNDDLDLCSVSSIYAIYLSLKYFEQTESKVLLINTTDDNGQYFSIILKLYKGDKLIIETVFIKVKDIYSSKKMVSKYF